MAVRTGFRPNLSRAAVACTIVMHVAWNEKDLATYLKKLQGAIKQPSLERIAIKRTAAQLRMPYTKVADL